MNGTRIEELKQLGGWETIEMVERYAHLAPEHLARHADNSKPIETAVVTEIAPYIVARSVDNIAPIEAKNASSRTQIGHSKSKDLVDTEENNKEIKQLGG
jgi:hypothetical protein